MKITNNNYRIFSDHFGPDKGSDGTSSSEKPKALLKKGQREACDSTFRQLNETRPASPLLRERVTGITKKNPGIFAKIWNAAKRALYKNPSVSKDSTPPPNQERARFDTHDNTSLPEDLSREMFNTARTDDSGSDAGSDAGRTSPALSDSPASSVSSASSEPNSPPPCKI